MNLLRDMAICQLDWQQCNSDPSLSILEFFVDSSSGSAFSYSHEYPSLDLTDPVACYDFVEENAGLCGGAAEGPPQNGNRKLSVITTKWQSKTVELQNFISEQASHHFVFC
jgi:hypothetical protein